MGLSGDTSVIDRIYGRIANGTSFFQEGWGELSELLVLDGEGAKYRPPAEIDVTWNREYREGGINFSQGNFQSPFECASFPARCRAAQIEVVLPRGWTRETPICIHFAATGDQGFGRRRRSMALPLAERGIAGLLLENSFYGERRPAGQKGKALRTFADLWMMGASTVQEGLALLRWLKSHGFTKLGVSGISMGGHMAASVAALWPEPLAVSPCIAPHSAQVVFTEGLLMDHCDWGALDGTCLRPEEAVARMRELLGVTDLRRYGVPAEPGAAFLVSARRDAYIPFLVPGCAARPLEGIDAEMAGRRARDGFSVQEKGLPGRRRRFLRGAGRVRCLVFASGV